MELVASVIALASLVLSAMLALRITRLEARLRSVEARPLPAPAPEEVRPPSPLQGLSVVLNVSQDHPHAPFVEMLKELLLREDVAEVILDGQADIAVKGEIRCNGYAEIYYSADLTCSTPAGAICTVVERPPHGDRPSNLAIELVAKLKREIDRVTSREERGAALRELRG